MFGFKTFSAFDINVCAVATSKSALGVGTHSGDGDGDGEVVKFSDRQTTSVGIEIHDRQLHNFF